MHGAIEDNMCGPILAAGRPAPDANNYFADPQAEIGKAIMKNFSPEGSRERIEIAQTEDNRMSHLSAGVTVDDTKSRPSNTKEVVNMSFISSQKQYSGAHVNIRSYLKANPQASQSTTSFHNQKVHSNSQGTSIEREAGSFSSQPPLPSSIGKRQRRAAQKESEKAFIREHPAALTNPVAAALDDDDGHGGADLQKLAVFQLLRKFKLQQYANKMASCGFGRDIYKLAFLSHRERDDLIESLNMLPGHRERMAELFRLVEQLNPKSQLRHALAQAMRQSKDERKTGVRRDKSQRETSCEAQDQIKRQTSNSTTKYPGDYSNIGSDSAQLSQSLLHARTTMRNPSSTAVNSKKSAATSKSKTPYGASAAMNHSRMSNSSALASGAKRDQVYVAAAGLSGTGPLIHQSSMSTAGQQALSEVKTPSSRGQPPLHSKDARRQLVREQILQTRQSTTVAMRSLSKGKRMTKRDRSGDPAPGTREHSSSLSRMYSQLDPQAKLALNQAFLSNIKSGRNHQTFHQAMAIFSNQQTEKRRAQKAIEQIFPMRKFVINNLGVISGTAAKKQRRDRVEAQRRRDQMSSTHTKVQRSNSRDVPSTHAVTTAKTNTRKTLQHASGNMNNSVNQGRPPLAAVGNYSASASKSQRKAYVAQTASKPLPPFIQTSSSGAFAGGAGPTPANQNLQMTSGRVTQHGGASSRSKGRGQASSSDARKPTTTTSHATTSGPYGPVSEIGRGLEGTQQSFYMKAVANKNQQQQRPPTSQYESYETPGKSSSVVALGLRKRRQSQTRGEVPSGTSNQQNVRSSNQRMRSSSYSQKKLKNEDSHQSLFQRHQAQVSKITGGVTIESDQPVNNRNSDLIGKGLMGLAKEKPAASSKVHSRKGSAKGPRPPVRSSQTSQNAYKGALQYEPRQLLSNRQMARNSLNQSAQKNEKKSSTKNLNADISQQSILPSIKPGSARMARAGSSTQGETSHVTDNTGQQRESLKEFVENYEKSQPAATASKAEKSATSPNYSTPATNMRAAVKLPRIDETVKTPMPEAEEQAKSSPEAAKEEHVDAVNSFAEPMLEECEKQALKNFGYSFNSKKMAMGPAFFNLRLICDCLGRALRRHLDYSQGVFWFLDDLARAKKMLKKMSPDGVIPSGNDLEESGASNLTAFSYNFPSDLKLGQRPEASGDDQDLNRPDSDEDADGMSINELDLQIKEQLDVREQRSVETIRREQLQKVAEKQGGATLSGSNSSAERVQATSDGSGGTLKVTGRLRNKSYVQQQLIEKDKKIKELTKMVQMYETGQKLSGLRGSGERGAGLTQEVLVIGTEAKVAEGDEDIVQKYESDVYKMTRAEFLMSQIDLDPIESHHSQEQQVSSHFNKHGPSALGSQQRLMAKTATRFGVSEPRGPAAQMPAPTNPGDENQNCTMVDGSFNSVSQGRSLNQSASRGPAELQGADLTPTAQTEFEGGDEEYEAASPPMKAARAASRGSAVLQLRPAAIEGYDQEEVNRQAGSPKELKEFSRADQLDLLSDQLRYFDERMEFDCEVFHEDLDLIEPSAEDIAAYAKYVTVASKMENEAPVIALVYIERILLKTGILINKYNWKRILLVCLCVASKVWDDDSLENVHFPKVMSDVTLNMINRLEQTFLDVFLNYDLVVKGSEYAKYYFIMRTLADEMRDESLTKEERDALQHGRKRRRRDDWAEYPLIAPISAYQMQQLQRNTATAEIYLKDRYEKEVIVALAPKFKGIEQKSRQKRFLVSAAEDKIQSRYEQPNTRNPKDKGGKDALEKILSSTL